MVPFTEEMFNGKLHFLCSGTYFEEQLQAANIREIVHSCYTQKNHFEKWCKIHKETAVQDSLFKKISELELVEAVYVKFSLKNRRLVKFPGAAGNPLVLIDFSRSPCLSCSSHGIACRLSRKNL